MNLFNYLMNKKGKKLVDNDHMLEYLLNKGTTPEKEATGTNINITDVTKEKIIKLTLDKESTQDGTPSPENPVEVKTVKGYRNLFDKDNVNILNAYIDTSGNILSASNGKSLYINCKPNTTYTVSRTAGTRFRIIDTNVLPEVGVIGNNFVGVDTSTSLSITTSNNANYLCVNYFNRNTDGNIEQKILDSIMIVEGTEELPYVPYGTNYVYTAISNGTDTNYYTIPLNNNEIAGIGDYKDELIVDKNGHCWLNKKVGKYIWDNSITSSSGGTFNTMKANGYICRYTNYYKDIIMSSNRALIMCNRLKATNNALWNGTNGEGIQISSGSKSIYMAMSYDTLETYYGSELTSNNVGNAWNDYFTNNYTEIYTPLETSQLIDLNYTVDIELFKGINNISNSDDMDMILKYY